MLLPRKLPRATEPTRGVYPEHPSALQSAKSAQSRKSVAGGGPPFSSFLSIPGGCIHKARPDRQETWISPLLTNEGLPKTFLKMKRAASPARNFVEGKVWVPWGCFDSREVGRVAKSALVNDWLLGTTFSSLCSCCSGLIFSLHAAFDERPNCS